MDKQEKKTENSPNATIWLKATDMPDTEKERNTYYITLRDGDKETIFVLRVHADGTIIAEPYSVNEYDYDVHYGDEEEEEEEESYDYD